MTDTLPQRIEAAEEFCHKCNATPLHGFWTRARAFLAYQVFLALPVPGKWTLYEKVWFAILPYVGQWAHSCHCAAALRAKDRADG